MEMISSKVALGIAGVCGTLFLGYCIYFDYRRHHDPEFKKKLRERRRANRLAASSGKRATVFPDMRDHDAVQLFFLQEIQLGEELMSAGEMADGIDHIANAVAVCAQPSDLLNLLQNTLKPEAFALLIEKLPSVAPRLFKSAPTTTMQEEDVE